MKGCRNMQSSFLTNIIRKIRSKTKNTRAQSAIEMGLVTPIIILLMIGSFDIAKVCTTYLDLNEALTYNLGELMKNGDSGAQYRAIGDMKRSFEKNSIFKVESFKITNLGPFPPGSRNTIGTVWCVDGEVGINVTYAKMFGGNTAMIRKRVCSLQEVATIK